jgi:cyanophycin synthetase
LPQATLLGQVYVGPIGEDGLARLDRILVEALDDLNLAPFEQEGPLGLLHRLAQLAAATQSLFGHPVSSAFRFIRRKQADNEGRGAFSAALPYHDSNSAVAVLNWAVDLINTTLRTESAAGEVRRGFAGLGKSIRPAGLTGINSVHLVRAAYQLDVPVARYVQEVYRYGTGIHSRALLSTLTDRTSALGVQLAKNKWQAAHILASASLPTGRPRLVTSADEAVLAADSIGYPVVLKPNGSDGGDGVSAGLATVEDVRAAYAHAAAGGRQVLIEKHFSGQDYRLTVHGGDVIKVEQRLACSIVGDGLATVGELVAAKQASAHLRRIERGSGKAPLSLDREALGLLASEGLTAQSVPAEGRRIPLRRQCNISTGGEQVAVRLADIHPDNAALAVRAAKLLFLDLAGVDLIVPDIRRSWREHGGIICEVNGIPQVGVRTSPDIYRDMLGRLIGSQHRIPAHLLITADGKPGDLASTMRLAEALGCNGIASGEGLWIDGQRTGGTPSHAFTSASSLLRDPDVRCALCVMSAADVREKGLPLDRFDTMILAHSLLSDNALTEALRPHAGSIVGASSNA